MWIDPDGTLARAPRRSQYTKDLGEIRLKEPQDLKHTDPILE